MRDRFFRWTAAALLSACISASPVVARTLELAPALVALNSDAGVAMLDKATARASYVDLSMQFVTQQTQSFCGVASIVMVLNALDVDAPLQKEYAPYRVFTQDGFFNEETEKVRPRALIDRRGMTVDQVGGLLGVHGAQARVIHASYTSLDEFRRLAVQQLSTKGHYLIVNYARQSLAQERGGHISPVAAYDEGSDRFLILDVARYKYPPVWVKAADLYAAMNTPDFDNSMRSRGFVLIDGARKFSGLE
jgi:hypothetical protein